MKNRKTFHHVGKYLLTGAAALLCGPLFAAELAEAGVRITPEGDLLDSKGNPRAWIGTDCSGGSVSQPERGGKAFRGRYNDKYRWIYETNVTAPQLHRLGFHILSTATPDTCVRAVFPEYKGFAAKDPIAEYDELIAKYHLEGMRPWSLYSKLMPYIYDQQILFWKSLGKDHMPVILQMQDQISQLSKERAKLKGILPDGLFFGSTNHSGGTIAVQIGRKEGQDIYRKIYRHRQEEALHYGTRPFAYKLFNEPIYWNYSPENKRLFAESLKKRYKDIAALNTAWGSAFSSFDAIAEFNGEKGGSKAVDVEYHKFQQEQVTELAKLLLNDLKELDPEARAMIQLHGHDTHIRVFPHFDYCALSKLTALISAGTGNNPLTAWMNYPEGIPFRDLDNVPQDIRIGYSKDSFYFAFADGKPVLNTEAYSENTFEGFRRMIWHEMAAGKETVIAWAWFGLNWGPDVKKPFSFALMNPNACPPEALEAFEATRKEIEAVGDIFLPRKNAQKAEVAALFSYPTLRFNHMLQEPEMIASSAPMQIQVPVDTILEEQLAENRQNRYKVILASGIHNVYPETNARLRKWIEDGGTLIVNQGLLNQDEYGRPLKDALIPFRETRGSGKLGRMEPSGIRSLATSRLAGTFDGWQVADRLHGMPAHLFRKIGKGELHVIAGTLTDFGYISLIRPVLEKSGVQPTAKITDAKTGDSVPGIEVRRFRSGTLTGWYFCNMNAAPNLISAVLPGTEGSAIVDPFGKESYITQNGKLLLSLPAKGERFVLISGPAEALEARFGKFPSKSDAVRTAEFRKEIEALAKNERKCRKSVAVNIASVANGGFYNYQNYPIDSIWQEGGVKELRAFPYHENVFGDLKFDIIRFDYNENRTSIGLRSKQHPEFPEKVSLPLHGKFRSVAFLQAATHGVAGETVMKLRFHYEDGKDVEVPVRLGRETGDWMLEKNGQEIMRNCVWKTDDGKQGVFLYEWENPEPEKVLSSVELISADSQSQPLIAGVTAVPSRFQTAYVHTVPLKDHIAKTIRGRFLPDFGGYTFSHNFVMEFKQALPVPADKLKSAVLRFEIRNNPDQWNIVRPWISLPVSLNGTINGIPANSVPGVSSRTTGLVNMILNENNPQFFTEIEIPLAEMLDGTDKNGTNGKLDSITSISFGAWGQTPFSRTIRNLRIEY